MKKRILLAALVLAAACAPTSPTAPEQSERELRPRNNGGYFGSGNRQEADSTKVLSGGYFGSGNLAEPVDPDASGDGTSGN